MSHYCYSQLSPGPDIIRLLRLMPNADENAPIQCELFEYSLQRSSKGTHLYEALSYVWGGPETPMSIYVDDHNFPITANLHVALSRLRDRSFVRIVWVDSVCINVLDEKERERRIQSLAKIYSQANRVVVWLGEAADDSDRAVEEIRVAAGNKLTNSSSKQTIQQAILVLLQRPWFRRIWVLQEVAAARHVLIMCGSTEIDGYAFCFGVESLKLSYEACPELQGLIRSVTYLIRESIFRPKHATSCSGRVSLETRPLGELIDMYHTHEATVRHDKVYALLEMSSDNLTADLLPNYSVPWKHLLERLIKYLLYEKVSVETWEYPEMAVIKSKGCILGYVSKVEKDTAWNDIQNVDITLKNISRYLGYEGEWSARWTLHPSAKSIQKGDLVCLLQGVSKPMIIRPCKDHFAVIMIAATPTEDVRTENGDMKWPELIRSITTFPRDFLLVWDWEKSQGKLEDQKYESRVPGHSKTELEDHLKKAIRLRDVALILKDSEEYEDAGEMFREAIVGYEKAFGKEHPHTLTVMDNLASIYKNKKQWKEAEELSLQVIRTRKRVQGIRHPDTLSSIANLESTYRDQGRLKGTEKLEVMAHLLDQREDATQISQKEVVDIARSFNKEVMTLLLEARGDEVPITEEAVKAVAGNWRSGAGLMTLLLERRGDDIPITEEVVKAAARNWRGGARVITLLLEQRGNDVPITKEVVKAAAGNKAVITLLLERRGDEVPIIEEVVKAAAGDKKVMTLLLERKGDEVPITEETMVQISRSFDKEVMSLILWRRRDEVPITEEVVKAAAENSRSGEEVIRLLLDRRGDKVPITEQVVKAAAENGRSGEEVMRLLLDRRGDKVSITEEVVKAAAGNLGSGEEVMRLLLDRRGDKVPITEEVVKAAAGNLGSGEEVMRLLLDRRGDKVPITGEVVKAAAGNSKSGEGVMRLLLNRRGDKVPITEQVVKAAASNENRGKAVMTVLLDRRGDEIPITEEVVKAAARNGRSGEEVMRLLLDRRGDKVPITEEVIRIARSLNKEVMMLLFEQRGDEVPIAEELVNTAEAEEARLYKPLSFEKSEFRLLKIHTLEEDRSPLSCSLTKVALHNAPQFVALSYCWGDLKNKTRITVNDLEVFVTVNLHAALRRLRAEGIEYVWVDFLCINQRDSEERSIQIGRMGTMFKQAKQVVVWLGEEQDIKEDDITSFSAAGAKMARHALPVSARRALNKLLSRPYWTRVWIIQELAVASSITILCGRHKLSWENFSNDSHNEFGAAADETSSDELETRFRKICQFRTDKLTGKPISLPNALYRSQSASSTDARDKLYALLGLVFDGDRFIPQPNYNLSIEETYTDFSLALIEKGLPLDFIYLRTSNRGIHDSLPSWVVDWSDLNDALAREEFRHISNLPAFSMPQLNQQNRAHAPENKLVVRGSIFGTIDGLSSAFFAGESDFVRHIVLTPEKRAALVQPDFDYSGYIFEALLEPRQLSVAGIKLPPSPIRLWSSLTKAELGQLVDGHMSPTDLERLSDWFDENRSLVTFGRTMEDWDSTWSSQPSNQDWRLSQSTCLRSLVTTIISGMRIAIFETGELGWVHPQSQKGDEIAKIVGCDRRIVLRPDLQGYRVIGEARPHWLAGEPDATEESLKIF